MLETFLQDVRYALRLLRRSPLFTRPPHCRWPSASARTRRSSPLRAPCSCGRLPGLAAPARLVDVGRTQDGRGFDNASYPNYRDLRERTKTLAGLYAYRVEPQPMSLGDPGRTPSASTATIVTANYFTVLGAHPQVGRLLQDSDDAPDSSHSVVVLSHELWTNRFAADPAIVGPAHLAQRAPVHGRWRRLPGIPGDDDVEGRCVDADIGHRARPCPGWATTS